MLRTQWTKRRSHDAERIAEQAWENLVSAVDSAGDSARDTARSARRRAKHLTGEAQDRVGSAAGEAKHRARTAYNALAGRREPPPWGLIIGLTAAGLVAGWLAAMAARRARTAIADTAADAEHHPLDEEIMGLRT